MLEQPTPEERALRRRNTLTLAVLVTIVLLMAVSPHFFREVMLPHFYKY